MKYGWDRSFSFSNIKNETKELASQLNYEFKLLVGFPSASVRI